MDLYCENSNRTIDNSLKCQMTLISTQSDSIAIINYDNCETRYISQESKYVRDLVYYLNSLFK